MEELTHIPVLLEESCKGVVTSPDGLYVDATVGGGGHSRKILSLLSERGRLYGFDRDNEAVNRGRLLEREDARFRMQKGAFGNIFKNLKDVGILEVDGILMDIGVSTYQLMDAERGFSLHSASPLDMRMDESSSLTAWDVVHRYSEEELEALLRRWSDLKSPRHLAKRIVEQRQRKPFESCRELADFIRFKTVASRVEKKGIHPATQLFQAIRMEVNAEMKELENCLKQAVSLLKRGGRLAVISFHSIEDRLVKNYFRQEATGCICDKRQPVCTCHHEKRIKVLTRKPILPTAEEVSLNPAARSGKLRIGERL